MTHLLTRGSRKTWSTHSSIRATPISQETLAEIVGTTRPRVSHLMNKFRKLGFISYNGHLEGHSSLLSVLLRD
jgi:CRP/FNR family transcriptional regulator, cyclic AMP receptor protein